MFLLLIFILTQTKHTPPTTEKVVPQMFRNNSAKQGLIFPEKHPYFTKVPAESKKEYKNPPMLIFYTITDKMKNPIIQPTQGSSVQAGTYYGVMSAKLYTNFIKTESVMLIFFLSS